MRCFLVEKRPNELGRRTSVYFIFIKHWICMVVFVPTGFNSVQICHEIVDNN